ncbi:hypothetical protein BDF19DRAFT_303226 [Syncephalis fuscata]|nr:hypothetical protein BDF19DRAFT_303226 [Syncephalis fuscata]
MSDLSSVSPAAFTSGYSDIKLQPYSDYSSQYSPTSNGNGMPPAPLPEDNGGNGGEFDLSDEQAEQLLRELDLLGAQLQIMDHETRMLGTKTGNNATRSSLSNNASAQFGRGNAVTPYRMQLTENPSDEQRNWETQSSLDIGSPDEEVGEGANGRSQSAGRSTRKQRALFVPRKPTTAKHLWQLMYQVYR